MAFELPALPNFNVAPPQIPSSLDQYGKMLQLKSLLGQQQLLPYQVQEAQQKTQQNDLALQQQKLELQSQQAMMKAWSDPKFLETVTSSDPAKVNGLGFDPDGMTKALITQGVLPKDALAMTNQFVERSQKMAETAKAQAQTGEALASTQAKGYSVLADVLGGVLDAPAAKAGDLFAQVKQSLVNNPKKFAGVHPQDLANVYNADLEHLPMIATAMGLDARLADFHKSKAEAAKAAQGVIPANGGFSPDVQQQVAKDVAVATNPEIQAGKVAVSEAEGRARANVEAAVARGGQAALAKVPTHLVAPAMEGAIKAGTEYAQAKSVSDRLAAMMDAAKNGNVVSYQLIPQEGALQVTTSQGVHRINMAEIQNYGGGSLRQRLEGHIGKQLTGASIPDSVLKDMSEMQKIQAEGSRTKYENTLKTINQATGADFKPVEMGDLNSGGANDFFSKFGGKAR